MSPASDTMTKMPEQQIRGCCRQSLRREVLPPGTPSNGLAVIVVAAAAMLFAVGSSAFILQARAAASCPYEQQQPAPVSVDADLPSAGESAPSMARGCPPTVTRTVDDKGRRVVIVAERSDCR